MEKIARKMKEDDYKSELYLKSDGKMSFDAEILFDGHIFLACLDVYKSLPKSPIRRHIVWFDFPGEAAKFVSVRDRMNLLLSWFHHREDITTTRVVGKDGRFGILFCQIKDIKS